MLNSVLRLNSLGKTTLSSGQLALSVLLIVGILEAQPVGAQSESAPRPRFEVVSIKPCHPGDVPLGRRRGGGTATPGDPGLLRFTCVPVDGLIRLAYLQYASGEPEPEASVFSWRIMKQDIAGEPSWAEHLRAAVTRCRLRQNRREATLYL